MAENSKIQWTDHTFNPWWGCDEVSPACDHCYARTLSNRFSKNLWGPKAERRVFVLADAAGGGPAPRHWDQPVAWNKAAQRAGVPAKVFCLSMGDVFDNHPTAESQRPWLWQTIRNTPWLRWQLLTKRIGNAARMLPWKCDEEPWPNVWLGATVVNQEEADRDIPKLLATPAAVRFLSIEPILGEIDLNKSIGDTRWIGGQRGCAGTTRGEHHHDDLCGRGVDWVICGGESGPKARDTEIAWIESIVRQCAAAGTACFVKQMGDRPVWIDHEPDLSEPPYFMRFDYGKKGADMDRWPQWARVRQFPTTAGAANAIQS